MHMLQVTAHRCHSVDEASLPLILEWPESGQLLLRRQLVTSPSYAWCPRLIPQSTVQWIHKIEEPCQKGINRISLGGVGKIILHRIISVVWLTSFLSETRILTQPWWWETWPVQSVKRSLNPIKVRSRCWWSLGEINHFSEPDMVLVWVVLSLQVLISPKTASFVIFTQDVSGEVLHERQPGCDLFLPQLPEHLHLGEPVDLY